ncbi:MAG: ANTAR domain-containing protein [Thermodesulfobacteriota bacterium]|nr:MAG: ANTAR domain-containing protein [Thermodesulfobacteriota bacterium]
MSGKSHRKTCKPLAELRAEIDRLKLELEEKRVVEKAKGLLVSTKGVTEREACELLESFSIEHNKTLIEAAEIILFGNRLLKPVSRRRKAKRKQ